MLMKVDDRVIPAAPQAPVWLKDFRSSAYGNGFYKSLNEYGAFFVERSTEDLIVSFDNLSSVRSEAVSRDPWGYTFATKRKWSHLGLMAYEPRWFRSETVFDYLQSLADEGFFRRFRNVTFTGTSMGGYAACAFSRISPGCRVIALSPQSTLDPELVPWEDRFAAGRKAEWSGRFRDAARQTRHAAQVWVIYDPEVENDARHAERFTGRNVTLLRARHAGHKTALFLRRAEILSKVMEEAASGVLSEARFYELYRRGRDLPWYLNAVTDRAAARGDDAALLRIARHAIANGWPMVAKRIARLHAGTALEAAA